MTSLYSSISRSIVYLVTHPHPNWFGQVTWLIGEGVPWVQIRDKQATSSELLRKTEGVLNFIEQQGLDTTVLLNDNVQVKRNGDRCSSRTIGYFSEARAILGPDVIAGQFDDVV